MNKHAELYPIRTVSSLTGVKPITLRAWERRYGLINPQRTESRHRLYSQEDINTINKSLEMLNKGISISQVSRIIKSSRQPESDSIKDTEDYWQQLKKQILDAIHHFDEYKLEEVYQKALSVHPINIVTMKLIMPILKTLGGNWNQSKTGIAEEHFFGFYWRNKLGARFHHRFGKNNGPKLLLACLPGEYHEAGLLLLALSAHEHNYQQIILGAHMELTSLALVSKQSKSDALILSASIKLENKVIDQLSKLVSIVSIPVFVGGQTSISSHSAIINAGAIALGTDIEVGLKHLDSKLKKHIN